MKKVPTLGLLLLMTLSLSACGSKSSKANTKENTDTLSKAKTDVDSLFTNSAHNKLLDGTTLDSIESTEKEVTSLKDSSTKTKLKKDTKTAKALYPAFKKENTRKESISTSKVESSTKVSESKEAQKASSESKSSAIAKISSEKNKSSESHEDVKAILSEMTKEQYLNVESKVLERMKFDDIKNPGDQGGLTRFHSSIDNLNNLKDDASSELKNEKQFLTDEDYNNLKKYNNSLQSYLSSLHDYAVTYQSDMPVINDSNTDEETRTDSQTEVNESSSDYDNAKNEWLEQYNEITQKYFN
ncbi:toxin Cry1Ac domain D-VI-related protein [Pediococcus pentosaceus]